MKIGLVLSKTPSYSETFFISKIKGLQQSGHEVILFVQKNDKDFKLCKVLEAPKIYRRNKFFQLISMSIWFAKFIVQPRRLLSYIHLEKGVNRPWKQILKNLYNNAHILKSHLDWLHFGFATMALQSEHVAKTIGAKMAVSLRGFDVAIYPIKHPRCYAMLWQNVDKVHTISNDLLSIAYKLGMYEDTAYTKITPAIDVSKFQPDLELNEKGTHESIKMLTVARLHWKKGLIDTLDALALLKKKGINFDYTIIGEGKELEELRFSIHQLKLSNHVTLLGKKTHEEVVSLLNQCDIYIQYSLSEGFCNAVLEAQAMGCLCIVSDVEGLSENVLHGQTGWVVPKRNPLALAEALINVIHLPDVRKDSFKNNAKERVIEKFNLDDQKKSFSEFYNSSS